MLEGVCGMEKNRSMRRADSRHRVVGAGGRVTRQLHQKESLSKDGEAERKGKREACRCLGKLFQAEGPDSAKAQRWRRNSRKA